MNNTISWFAPKNKVYCGTSSLTNRICLAVLINSVGVTKAFSLLFHRMNIALTPDVLHFLELKEKGRVYRLNKIGLQATKKDRKKRKFEQLKEDEAVARKEQIGRAHV